ncbi:hypothetical protein LXA43DRAFT_317061 [Ganoderma leucocontextum]|nr:hypothetical protein LXA43DRAFT_317061 [Ganoderma leucocontextum]
MRFIPACCGTSSTGTNSCAVPVPSPNVPATAPCYLKHFLRSVCYSLGEKVQGKHSQRRFHAAATREFHHSSFTPFIDERFRLETLNFDVLWLIAEQIPQPGWLRALSLVSRTTRNLVLPLLFSRCLVDTLDDPDPLPAEEFPDALCAYVLNLTHRGPFRNDRDVQRFQGLVARLTSLTSITFTDTRATLSPAVIKPCLTHPCITSLSFNLGNHDDCLENLPLTAEDLASVGPLSLTRLSWTPTMWRERGNMVVTTSRRGSVSIRWGGPGCTIMTKVYALENNLLGTILLGMSDTATSLSLPMESAPIDQMRQVWWPRLKHLSLFGRFRSDKHAHSIGWLLPYLPALESLSIQAARYEGRQSILPEHPQAELCTLSQALRDPSSRPRPLLPNLRSLTIAYPEPTDQLFSSSCDWSRLTHLSLRDCPRLYFGKCAWWLFPTQWCTAALTAQECLSVLKRMKPFNLRSLEFVYYTDSDTSVPASEEDLFGYIGQMFAQLEHLEIHRYHQARWNRKNAVPYVHIARLLTAIKSLRTAKLNLDFGDDCHAYRCSGDKRRKGWFRTYVRRGTDILEAMRRGCPLLHHVELLYHGHPGPTWLEFHPAPGRKRKPKVVCEHDPAHIDSEMYPRTYCPPYF